MKENKVTVNILLNTIEIFNQVVTSRKLTELTQNST